MTPLCRGVTQLAALDTFAQTEAEIVVSVGPTCESQAMRTFTQGQFWESYPHVLAASRFVRVTDAGTVKLPSGPAAAPCADARGLRAQGDVVALICESTAFVAKEGDWIALPTPDAAAIAIDGVDVIVAHAADGCSGLALTRFANADRSKPERSQCAPGLDRTAPTAITSTDGGASVWSGEALVTVP